MKKILLVAAGLFVAVAAIAYFGVINVAADEPHWDVTYRVLESMRDRSIAMHARDIEVPALTDAGMIAEGAHHYDEMCTECHLAPGMQSTQLRAGLYPQPPELADRARRLSPSEAFWVTKHGLKMTGMPAWGRTHDDEEIWAIVAFLQRLPELSPEEYAALAGERGEVRDPDDERDGQEPGRTHSHEDDARPHRH